MNDPGDRNFHLLMAMLLLASLIVDQQEFEAWRAGRISMITLVLAGVWLGRFTADGFRRREAATKVVNSRVAALEERLDELERDAKEKRGPFG